MNLALPSWTGLIDHIAADLEYDPDEFRKLGNFLELAEYCKLEGPPG
ncbi:MAG: hypothetical protein R3338_01380 [Thermoanaerobaculia bacterium]|nr:hypothetical protein [Thermoanaerobaculia bacterium]